MANGEKVGKHRQSGNFTCPDCEQHAPGPWQVTSMDDYLAIRDANGREIAGLRPEYKQVDGISEWVPRIAEGRLIAAAPTMAEELELVSLAMNTAIDNLEHWTPKQMREHLLAVQGRAQNAFNKATGRA